MSAAPATATATAAASATSPGWTPPPVPCSLPPAPAAAAPEAIGVMIPNLNDRRGLLALLDSLVAQSFPTMLLDIVIADNGSSDASVADVQWLASQWSGRVFGRLEILPLGANLGAPAAYNAALRRLALTNRAVLKLDSDVVLEPGCIQALLDRLRSAPEVGAVGGREYSLFDTDRLLSLGVGLVGPALRPTFPTLDDPAVQAEFTRTGCLALAAPAGACALFDGALLRALGGLDEAFFVYYDDIDLGLRVRLAGRRCLCDPRAVYRHRKSGTTGARTESAFHRFHEARSSLLFARKYGRGTQGEAERFAWGWNLRSNLRFLCTFRPTIALAGCRGLWSAARTPRSPAAPEIPWIRSGR
ncbi:MAG: glycosyltransferase [Planctomycetota bacterium]